jgi:hypothetical protein
MNERVLCFFKAMLIAMYRNSQTATGPSSRLSIFIHSFSSLSYDRSKASSKGSSPHSAIWELPPSNESILSFPEGHPVASYVFFLVFLSRLSSFYIFFNPIQLVFRLLISCRIFLCSLTLSNTSSFLTWSVQLIFSILLQHHISKLSTYFCSTARIGKAYTFLFITNISWKIRSYVFDPRRTKFCTPSSNIPLV